MQREHPAAVLPEGIVALMVTLKADLERYAMLHAQTYGDLVDAATLADPAHTRSVHSAGSRIQAGSSTSCRFCTEN